MLRCTNTCPVFPHLCSRYSLDLWLPYVCLYWQMCLPTLFFPSFSLARTCPDVLHSHAMVISFHELTLLPRLSIMPSRCMPNQAEPQYKQWWPLGAASTVSPAVIWQHCPLQAGYTVQSCLLGTCLPIPHLSSNNIKVWTVTICWLIQTCLHLLDLHRHSVISFPAVCLKVRIKLHYIMMWKESWS